MYSVLCVYTEALQKSADYSRVDPTRLDTWLLTVNKELSIYTYNLLQRGIDRATLLQTSDEILESFCGISNPVHLLKIRQALDSGRDN